MIFSEIYSASPDHRRECTYYIAVGYYKLRNYAYARKFNNLLLSVEPGNMQAQSLSTLIENAVKRDGLIGKFEINFIRACANAVPGIGMITGAVAVVGLIAGSVWKRSRK